MRSALDLAREGGEIVNVSFDVHQRPFRARGSRSEGALRSIPDRNTIVERLGLPPGRSSYRAADSTNDRSESRSTKHVPPAGRLTRMKPQAAHRAIVRRLTPPASFAATMGRTHSGAVAKFRLVGGASCVVIVSNCVPPPASKTR